MKKQHIIAIVASVAIILLGAGTASFALTAPGISVNGTNIGLTTTSNAAEKLQDTLKNSTVNINDQEFTYDELGVTYDKDKLDELLSNNKAYNFGSWNSSVTQAIVIDEDKMRETVSEQLPETYKDPTNADVTYNEEKETWETVSGENGTGPIVETLREQIEKDITENKFIDEGLSYTLEQQDIEPTITNNVADDFVALLNEKMDNAGFYEGDDKKADIKNSEFVSFINVEQTEDGFTYTVNEDKLREVAETVPDEVNTEVDNGSAVTDEDGKILKTLDAFSDGYAFNDVDGLVSRATEQLSDVSGNAEFALNGETTEAKVDEKFRRIEVDLDAREVRTYENDKLVKSYDVAIGKPATPTDKGNFKVYHQTQVQDMGCSSSYDYCTKDVKWSTFYNGGEAFHGTWWHNDFGNPNASQRSHGCVNMTESDAKEIYYFAQYGTPVHVF